MDKTPGTRVDIPIKTLIKFWLIPLVIGISIAAFIWASSALVMIFIAFFLAVILNRPTEFLNKYIKSRSVSAGIALFGLILVVILAFSTVIPLFVKQTVSFVSTVPEAFSHLQQSSDAVYGFLSNNGLEQQYTQIIDNAKNSIVDALGGAAQNIAGLFGGILNAMIVATLVLVMAFFMLVEGPTWMERYWRLVYRSKSKKAYHQRVVKKMYNVVSGYVNGTAVIGLLSALLGGLGLFIVTFISPVPIDVVVPSMLVMFICAFIPMFGATIAGIIICLLLLLYSWPAALVFAIYFTIYQQIENNIFVPRIFAKHVKISTLTVLVAVVIGTYCGGLLGIFIAIPAAGCLQILALEFIHRRELIEQRRIEKLNVKHPEHLPDKQDASDHGSDDHTEEKP